MKNKANPDLPSEESTQSSGCQNQDLQRIAGLVAGLPDRQPPAALMEAVMGKIRPKRLGLRKRILWTLHAPITLSPFKVLPIGVSIAAAILLAAVFWKVGPERPTAVLAPRIPPKNAAPVLFTLEMPGASSVHVVGSFNGWRPGDFPMRWDDSRKIWTISLPLEKGWYEYAFLVDGKRLVQDPKALLQQEDGFGHRNSVLIIERNNGHEKAL
jgi:hypothetical protein